MITLKQYYEKVARLETPSHLLNLEDIQSWWLAQFAKLQKELTPEDLAELKENEKRWQDKVNSSL